MNNHEFGKHMELRTRKFAISVIELSSLLKSSIEINVIKNQLSKSGTSIGANYREANRARSRADFLHKIKICESETNETIYWLEVLIDLNQTDNSKISLLMIEANELLALFTSIVTKLRLS